MMSSMSIESAGQVEELYTDPKTIKTLANNFVSIYENDLKSLNHHLEELTKKQNCLISELVKEKASYEQQNLESIQEMMNNVKKYKEKVHSIKKQMTTIHQRVKTLKKKAQDIEDFKVKEQNQRNQKRLQEEALIARSSK